MTTHAWMELEVTLRVGEQLTNPSITPDRSCRPSPTFRLPQQHPSTGAGCPPPAGSGHGPARRRILMLSWEYPPVLVGGLGRHVHA
ncbi:hypothetical protein V6U90_23435, partial [Micromonospora sp. CPCC 206060]